MNFKLKIIYKLIIYLVIVSVLPLLIFAVVSYDVMRQTLLDSAVQNSSQLVGNQRDYLQLQLEQIENLATRIASIEEIGTVLAKTDATNDGEQNIYDELSTQAEIRKSLNLYSSLKGIVSTDLFTAKGHHFFVGDTLTVPPVNDIVRQTIYQNALSEAPKKSMQWIGIQANLNTSSSTHNVLTLLKIIDHFSKESQLSEPIGMLMVNYSADYLYRHFNQVDMGKDSYMIITDSQHKMIYSPDQKNIGLSMPIELKQLLEQTNRSRIIHLNGHDNLVTMTSLNNGSWHVFGIIPEETLLAPMTRLSRFLLLLIVLSFGVILLTSRIFRRNMVTPIQAISDAFRKIYDKKISAQEHLPVPSTDDEISELVVWYNAFLDTQKIRLQYEQDLLDSQYKFATIFNQAPLPLVLIRIENGEIVDVNDFWLEQFGFLREEIIGRTSIELGMWDDLSERTKLLEQIKHTEVIKRFETKQRTKDGRTLICYITGRPVKFLDEIFYIFSSVDITAQRVTENEIQEINSKLESRVLARTAQLQKSNNELSQTLETLSMAREELVRSEKLAALGSLVAGVAHEINTPVGIIVTSASVLNDASLDIMAKVNEGAIRKSQITEFLAVAIESSRLMMANAQRAAHLIQSFKQVAVDQTSEQRREFELNEFIQDLIASLNPTLRKAKTVIDVLPRKDQIIMDSYPGLLAQVLTNLTMNAVIHAFHHRDSGRIVIETDMQNQMVHIDFKDDGVGIPEDILSKIFDPFFTTRRGDGGTGLGLNIVFNIVDKQFGGTITAENNPTGGAIFKLCIPCVTREISTLYSNNQLLHK